MTCTLTAVPYPSTDVTPRYNPLLNPEAQGLGSWSYYAGGGLGSLNYQTIAGDRTAPPGVPLTGRILYLQGTTSATAAVNVMLAAGPGIVNAGQVRTLSAYVRASAATQVRMVIDWRNASNVNVGYTAGPLVPVGPPSPAFVRISATGPAPAGATSFVLTVQAGTTGAWLSAGQWVMVAAPLADAAATPGAYFSGATPSTPGVSYTWAGPPHASVSAMTVRTPITELAVQSTPTLVLDYSAPRESGSVEHPIIGRPDPVHAVGPLRTRKGNLDLFYPTLQLARAAERVHESARVMLRDSEDPELNMYYVPRAVTLTPTPERTATQRWRLSVDYTEVYATAGLY